jgi:hypothetical protein
MSFRTPGDCTCSPNVAGGATAGVWCWSKEGQARLSTALQGDHRNHEDDMDILRMRQNEGFQSNTAAIPGLAHHSQVAVCALKHGRGRRCF